VVQNHRSTGINPAAVADGREKHYGSRRKSCGNRPVTVENGSHDRCVTEAKTFQRGQTLEDVRGDDASSRVLAQFAD